MSDDWFDRAYRSDETPPEEINARVLAAARRVTRRWVVPTIAAAVATLLAALLIALALVSHELYVPPVTQPVEERDAQDQKLRLELDRRGAKVVPPVVPKDGTRERQPIEAANDGPPHHLPETEP